MSRTLTLHEQVEVALTHAEEFARPWSCTCSSCQQRYRAAEVWPTCSLCGERIPPDTDYPGMWHAEWCGLEDE
jgi:hypothetical protein